MIGVVGAEAEVPGGRLTLAEREDIAYLRGRFV